MKKLVIRENQGRFHLEKFGPSFCGYDGSEFFSLVIESKDQGLVLEVPEVTLFDLFARFDLRDPAFLDEKYTCPDFVRILEERGECAVETCSGTLYDLFRERLANGRYLIRGSMPVSFFWRGSGEGSQVA